MDLSCASAESRRGRRLDDGRRCPEEEPAGCLENSAVDESPQCPSRPQAADHGSPLRLAPAPSGHGPIQSSTPANLFGGSRGPEAGALVCECTPVPSHVLNLLLPRRCPAN